MSNNRREDDPVFISCPVVEKTKMRLKERVHKTLRVVEFLLISAMLFMAVVLHGSGAIEAPGFVGMICGVFLYALIVRASRAKIEPVKELNSTRIEREAAEKEKR